MDETEDLIERLLVMAGAMLEDASAVALIASERSRSERLDELMRVNSNVQSLIAAAAALNLRQSR